MDAFKSHRLDVADADETTVNNELKALRMMGRWLAKRGTIDFDPFAAVDYVKDEGEPSGRSLEDSHFAGIVRAAKPSLQRWLLVVGLHGLRKGEANHLRPQDIKVEDRHIDICIHRNAAGKPIWKPKFGIERKVPFVEELVRDLPTDKKGHVLGVHDRRKALARAVLNAEVDGHVRFHDFRHTAYTKLKEAMLQKLDKDLALSELKLIFGHGERGMDRVYDHASVERMRRVIELMPLLDGVSELLVK